MSYEAVFRIANFLAVIGWIVLILAALFRWERGLDRVAGFFIPLVLSGTYVAVLATHWGSLHGDFSSMAGVAALFRQPAALLAGWVHYLAFDMLVGAMLARRMMDERIPRVLMLIVLPVTFFLGPAGFVVFHLIRGARIGLGSGSAGGRPARPRPRAARVKKAKVVDDAAIRTTRTENGAA